ncbi:MAG: alkaline phosphatase family protein [Pseudomonadota bacterium]|nr:alkaline phosphatase family protein [Pseudomonadota bacterium]
MATQSVKKIPATVRGINRAIGRMVDCIRATPRPLRFAPLVLAALCASVVPADAAPKVVLISLDGATPRLVESYLAEGSLPANEGLGLLKNRGVAAKRNFTVSPSLTAPGHIAIATGSIASKNDVVANSFHLVASPFASNISGFAAPIGGYDIHGPSESQHPTAEPLWLALRAAGKKVVTATFPGGDGLDIKVPGLTNSPIIQSAAKRTVDYTVPFGAFAGVGAKGFTLAAGGFGPAPQAIIDQLNAAGRKFFGPALQKTSELDSFTSGGQSYSIQLAALDSSDDATTNYDTLVFFDAARGIEAGPFTSPATGPAFVRAADARSSPFFLEGTANRAGTSFYVSSLKPDLSLVRIARYSANAIPRNAPVIASVDDINRQVGFWLPQPDFRIPERLSPGFDDFPDAELEAIYLDQVRTFTDYQTRVALRAIEQNPDADLVMTYFEQPDGAGHQFLITDPRQATDPRDPDSIGANQDQAKIARYQSYLRIAYRTANEAVQRIIDAVGVDDHGRPRGNVLVVSDHGFAPFHTAVALNNYLASKGFDPKQVRAVTSGPAANIYINLQGREPDGTVSPAEYVSLQRDVAKALRDLVDRNPRYAPDDDGQRVFDNIYRRPLPANLNDAEFGRGTARFIGQDSGDVYALLSVGYNFDGTQTPVVQRAGDESSATPVFSIPNFYGAHGYDPKLRSMSAIFYAAGPDIRHGKLGAVRNIDMAPTILRLLDVKPAATVQGRALRLDRGRGDDDDEGGSE